MNNTGFEELVARKVEHVVFDTTDATIALATPASDRTVRLLSMVISADAAIMAELKSGTTSLGKLSLAVADTPVVLNDNPNGWCQTARGEALNLVGDGTITLTGWARFVEL